MDSKEIYCSSNMEEKMAKNETISIDINLWFGHKTVPEDGEKLKKFVLNRPVKHLVG